MCDSLAEGGRRCPLARDPAHRAALRVARVAAARAADHAPATVPPPDHTPPAMPAGGLGSVEGRIWFAQQVHAAHTDPDARTRLEAEYGSVEEASTTLGAMIGARAEQLAGVDTHELADHAATVYRDAAQELERLSDVYVNTAREDAAGRHTDAVMTANANRITSRSDMVELLTRNGVDDDTTGDVSAASQHPNPMPLPALLGREPSPDETTAYEKACDAAAEHARVSAARRAAEDAATAPMLARRAELVTFMDNGGTDEHTKRSLARLADGYRAAVAETRGMGGTHGWHDDSEPAAVTAFNESLAVFPTDWVEASANADPVVAKTTTGRANQRDAHNRQETIHRQYVTRHESDQPNAGYDQWDAHVETVLVARAGDPVPAGDRVTGSDEGPQVYEKHQWDVRYYEVHQRRDPYSTADEVARSRPKGRGWKLYRYESEYGLERAVWRRPDTYETTRTVHEPSRVLTGDKPAYAHGQTTTYGTSVHELTHRMETVVPGVAERQAEFLRRRTTTPDGKREPLSEIYPDSDEYGRKDELVSHYMGREYGPNAKHHEVMSCGMEALFSGRYGGLVGAGPPAGNTPRAAADRDMRAFVLGVLATAGRKDSPTPTTRSTSQDYELAATSRTGKD